MATFFNQVLDGSECCECDSSRTSPCDPCDEGCPYTVCLEDNRPSSTSGYYDYSGTYDQNGTHTSGGITSLAYVRRSDGAAWIYKDWGIHATYGYWVVGVNKGDTPSSTPNAVTQISTYTLNPCPDDYMAGSSIWDSPLASNPGVVDDGDCNAGACIQYCDCEPSYEVESTDEDQLYGNSAGDPPDDLSVTYYYGGEYPGSYDWGTMVWTYYGGLCKYEHDGNSPDPGNLGTFVIWCDEDSAEGSGSCLWTATYTESGGAVSTFERGHLDPTALPGSAHYADYGCDEGPLGYYYNISDSTYYLNVT